MSTDLVSSTHGGSIETQQLTLSDAALEMIDQHMSAATARAYRSDLYHVHEYLVGEGLTPGVDSDAPDANNRVATAVWQATANPAVIANYLTASAAEGLKPSTLSRRVAAISKVHATGAAKTLTEDSRPTRSRTVTQALKGARNAYRDRIMADPCGQMVKKPTALLKDQINEIIKDIDPETHAGARDAALIALGFWGAFRRSELVALNVEDLELDPERGGLIVTVRQSKTDQGAEGQKVPIHGYPETPERCPIALLLNYLSLCGITTGAIFRQVSREGRLLDERLGAQAVGRILLNRGNEVGIEGDISAHSLRSGRATEGGRQGQDIREIMTVGRWKTVAVALGYIQNADPLSMVGKLTN